VVVADRGIRVSIIVDELGVSEATILKILHEGLGMSKISECWIPKLLNSEQKLCRQQICEENLEALSAEELFSKVIGDETWVHYWDTPRRVAECF
jgi:predicted transcriptional regulator